MPPWVETDTAEECIGALEQLPLFLGLAAAEPRSWRWVIIDLHLATQGFMVVALKDTAGLIPLSRSCAKRWMLAYRTHKTLPEEHLDDFLNLYSKISNAKIAAALGARVYRPTEGDAESVARLNRLRNCYVHFLPRSRYFDTSGLPNLCLSVLSFVEFLSRDFRPQLWNDDHHEERIERALLLSRRSLDRTEAPLEG